MKALVTGATGFLGKALANRLQSMGWQVTALGRNDGILKLLASQGLQVVKADLADKNQVMAACKNQDIVFHSGALASDWGKKQEFYNSNVLGTQNVIQGCMHNQVKRLVHVSTPSIYFQNKPRLNVKETDPLPSKAVNEYARTKLLAEELIDKAFLEGLSVITIRPRAIYGPGDQTILPRVIDRLERGVLRQIGNGENIIDLSYVENVVDSLLLCAEIQGNPIGKKYNITNGEPIHLWKMIQQLCEKLNLHYPTQKLPLPLANSIAGSAEWVCSLLPGQPEPFLTRYSVAMLSTSSTLDISAARQDLGYKPRISNQQGFDLFVDWWLSKNKANHL